MENKLPVRMGLSVGRVAVTFILLMYFVQVPAIAVGRTLPADSEIAAAISGVEQFRANQDPKALSESASNLRNLVVAARPRTLDPQDKLLLRRKILRGYTAILHEIEAAHDPAFDIPNNPDFLPAICLIPPPDSDGSRAPSCAPPKAIKDPIARRQYEADLKANEVKVRKTNFQRALKNADDATTFWLTLNLRELHDDSTLDARALDTILSVGGLSATRKAVIRSLY